ncbi:MAG: hypothetical protein ACYCW6_15335 [Candidatus Xenobia bacterium]
MMDYGRDGYRPATGLSLLLATLFSQPQPSEPRAQEAWTGVRAWFEDLDLTRLGRWQRGS